MSQTDIPVGADGESPAPEPKPIEPVSAAPTPPAARSRPRAGTVLWLGAIVIAIALAIAFMTWRSVSMDAGQGERTQADLQRLQARLDTAAHSADQAQRETQTLRERLDDAGKVNASLREQLLGLNERARRIEESLAGIADTRRSGRDTLLLDEAEMLLVLGAERYALFHDPAAAIEAYREADAALAAADDAAFSTVRQSISAEGGAFARLQHEAAAAPAALAALRSAVARLPAPKRELQAAAAADAPRWQRLLGEFVRVRRVDAGAQAGERHEAGLARELVVLALRDADAALLARDTPRFRAALGEAQSLLEADFDADAIAGLRPQIDALRQLDPAPVAPAGTGSALEQLRNLRATQAPHAAPSAAPAPDSGQS